MGRYRPKEIRAGMRSVISGHVFRATGNNPANLTNQEVMPSEARLYRLVNQALLQEIQYAGLTHNPGALRLV